MTEKIKERTDSTPTKTAQWNIRGDGIAYTTAKAVLNSAEGRRYIDAVGKIKLASLPTK